jgi:hypothetical protein
VHALELRATSDVKLCSEGKHHHTDQYSIRRVL